MSKILDATADANGKVFYLGSPVESATVLGEGKQQSVGLLFLDADKARYLPSAGSDLKTTLTNLIDALDDINSALTTVSTTLTAIGAGMTGPTTAPPGSLPTNVADIVAKVAEIATAKTALTTLKDGLK